MAKRFTDTDKWKKKFIRGLDASYKVLWLYILDDCNHAGVWEVDIEVAEIRTGCEFIEKNAIEYFGNKIQVFDNKEKWFIPDFIDFQYGILNPKNRVHESVLTLLNKYENKGLIRGLLDPKDKDKDKLKDKDKENLENNFLKAIELYGKKTYLMDAQMEYYNLTIEEHKKLLDHIPKFIENHKKANKTKYLPRFSNYLIDKRWMEDLPYSEKKKEKWHIDKDIANDPDRMKFN